jgi:antitoxin (DNA-binding transcriptional repressor) of toxin-antitoxin stability system
MRSITIKELHDKTGENVRKAGKSQHPIGVTDHGKLVAVLSAPSRYQPKTRRRVLLPEYEAFLAKEVEENSVLDDLDAVRNDR